MVEATIDYAGGFVTAHAAADHYATLAPQDLLDQRIRFCLGVHTDATKVRPPSRSTKAAPGQPRASHPCRSHAQAMQFPPNAYRKYLETAEQRREREDLERELEREIEDAMDEGDGDL